MEQSSEEISDSIMYDIIRRIDRRNYIILAVIGVPMVAVSLFGSLTEGNVLPILWGEVSVVLSMGLLYYWAIRKQRIDLRLGCVYTSAGILVSFILITIGFLGTILVGATFPFLAENNQLSLLILIPTGIAIFVTYRVSEPIGLKVAKNQYSRINQELSETGHDPLNLGFLYLPEKKWTDPWFYLFLVMIIELVPIILQTATTQTLITTTILVTFFIALLIKAYFKQKRSKGFS